METFTLEDGAGELLLRQFPDGSISFMVDGGPWVEMSPEETTRLGKTLGVV